MFTGDRGASTIEGGGYRGWGILGWSGDVPPMEVDHIWVISLTSVG